MARYRCPPKVLKNAALQEGLSAQSPPAAGRHHCLSSRRTGHRSVDLGRRRRHRPNRGERRPHWRMDVRCVRRAVRGTRLHRALGHLAGRALRWAAGSRHRGELPVSRRRPSPLPRTPRPNATAERRVAWSERGPSEHFRWASGCTLAVISMPVQHASPACQSSMPVQHASPTGGQEAPPGTLRCGAATVRGGRYRLMEDPPLAYR